MIYFFAHSCICWFSNNNRETLSLPFQRYCFRLRSDPVGIFTLDNYFDNIVDSHVANLYSTENMKLSSLQNIPKQQRN